MLHPQVALGAISTIVYPAHGLLSLLWWLLHLWWWLGLLPGSIGNKGTNSYQHLLPWHVEHVVDISSSFYFIYWGVQQIVQRLKIVSFPQGFYNDVVHHWGVDGLDIKHLQLCHFCHWQSWHLQRHHCYLQGLTETLVSLQMPVKPQPQPIRWDLLQFLICPIFDTHWYNPESS